MVQRIGRLRYESSGSADTEIESVVFNRNQSESANVKIEIGRNQSTSAYMDRFHSDSGRFQQNYCQIAANSTVFFIFAA